MQTFYTSTTTTKSTQDFSKSILAFFMREKSRALFCFVSSRPQCGNGLSWRPRWSGSSHATEQSCSGGGRSLAFHWFSIIHFSFLCQRGRRNIEVNLQIDWPESRAKFNGMCAFANVPFLVTSEAEVLYIEFPRLASAYKIVNKAIGYLNVRLEV
jgi:hypothetical protein